MIVKTDYIKERGVSIGMFSRQGASTATLNSNFRDKRLKHRPPPAEKNHDSSTNLQTEESTPSKPRQRGKSAKDYFFRTVSREKNPRALSGQGTDAGLYKPKFDLVTGRAITLPISRLSENSARQTNNRPFCLQEAMTCEYKIRELQRKIAKKIEEVSENKLDLHALYNEKMIEKDVYKRLCDPELGIASDLPGPMDSPASRKSYYQRKRYSVRKGQTNVDLQVQQDKIEGILNQVREIDELRAELQELTEQNYEEYLNKEGQIVEKVHKHVPTPIPLDHQTERPPLVKKDIIHAFEDISLNKSTLNESFSKIHKFSSYVDRNPYKSIKGKCLQSYFIPMSVFELTRTRTTCAQVRMDKQKERESYYKTYLNSTCDYSNLNDLSFTSSVSRKDFSLVKMDRAVGRNSRHFTNNLERTTKPMTLLNSSSLGASKRNASFSQQRVKTQGNAILLNL